MTSHLGMYVREQRQKMGLSWQKLARRIGYKNLNKGARRLENLENQGSCTTDLLRKIAEVLNLDHEEIKKRVELDRKGFERFLDEPVPMQMIVRLIPGFYASHSLPNEIKTKEGAMAYAREYAKTHNLKVCLILSNRYSFWIDESGKGSMAETTQENPINMPHMIFPGSGKEFLFAISERE